METFKTRCSKTAVSFSPERSVKTNQRTNSIEHAAAKRVQPNFYEASSGLEKNVVYYITVYYMS